MEGSSRATASYCDGGSGGGSGTGGGSGGGGGTTTIGKARGREVAGRSSEVAGRSLRFTDAALEAEFWQSREQSLLQGDFRLTLPYVAVHAGLLLKLLSMRASLASTLLCLVSTLSVAAAAYLSGRRRELWSRWREPFLSVGHVLYEAEGAAMLRSFAVIMCSPPLLFWASALLTTAVPWLILDPVLMPISYHRLRWVQPLSVAVLFPTNALRCSLTLSRCGGDALRRFRGAATALGLGSRLLSPVGSLLDEPAAQCSCIAILTFIQIALGLILPLRVVWWRERGFRLRFALERQRHTLARQLRQCGRSLLGETAEMLLLAVFLWPLVQSVAPLLA